MQVIKLNGANFADEVLQADSPVLVDFWATWCGPCQAVGPIVEEMARVYDGKVKVGKVNVDENRELANRYGVMSIPTLIMFKGGEEASRTVGFQGKQHLQRFIENYI